MLISLFSVLVCPFGTLVLPFAASVCGWGSRSFGFAASGFGWVVFLLAVRGLGCELGRLASIFSVHVCPLGTLVLPFAVLVCGCVSRSFGFVTSGLVTGVFSLAVKGLGCE